MMEYNEIVIGAASDITVEEPLHNTYFKLMQIIEGLEDLKFKGSYTSRDIGHLQNKLHAIDAAYNQAAFKKQGMLPGGQAVVSELLEEAHELAYALVCKLPGDESPSDTELRAGLFKVDPSLRNVYIRLLKAVDDLDELDKKEEFDSRELGLLQNRLNELDQMYSEAAFHKAGTVPEGQAIVVELLEKGHDLAHKLAEQLEKDTPTDELRTGIYSVDESLRGFYVKLLNIIDALDELSTVEGYTSKDVGRLQNKLKSIEFRYKEAAFKKQGVIPAGQAIIAEMLDRARDKAHDLAFRAVYADPESQWAHLSEPMKKIYLKLINIVDALEKLKYSDDVTTRDVGALQNKLSAIDAQYQQTVIKKDGQIPSGQALVSELLHEARELAHDILCKLPPSDADVDESLRSVYYKLSHIIEGFRALKEKEFTGEEVGRLQNKLSRVDDLYKQAAIKRQGVIPNGQAVVADMLNEAHELAHELVCQLPDSDPQSYSPIEEELASLLDSLLQLQDRPHLRRAEVAKLQEKLKEIEADVVEKRLDDESIQMKINQAYGMIYELIIELGPKKDLSLEIDETLWPVETELKKVIHALHELRRKPIRHIKERDLRYAQDKLREVDELYAEGAFGKLLQMQEPLKGQAVLSSMLNKAHQMLYDLQCRLPEEPEQ